MAETTMEPWSFTIVFDEDKAKKNGYEGKERVDGQARPSTLSLPVSRLDETCRIGRLIIFR